MHNVYVMWEYKFRNAVSGNNTPYYKKTNCNQENHMPVQLLWMDNSRILLSIFRILYIRIGLYSSVNTIVLGLQLSVS